MLSEGVKNEVIKNIYASTPDHFCMKSTDGKQDILGLLFSTLGKENGDVKIKWIKNEHRPDIYDLFYQTKRGYDYKYGGTFGPTVGLLNAFNLDDNFITDLFMESDINEQIKMLQGGV